jgi:hypothetical protein
MASTTHGRIRSARNGVGQAPWLFVVGATGALMCASAAPAPDDVVLARDPTGVVATVSATGSFDTHNPFFRSLGSNGRSCGTCHLPSEAMSFTPAHARALYGASHGADPLFASVDGADCPEAAANDRAAHRLILGHGLIRVAVAVPANAQYSLSLLRGPRCALRVDPGTQLLSASVYRRPLPSSNLTFLSAVMFDGRETLAPLTAADSFPDNLRADLAHQAVSATLGHAQARAAPGADLVQAIVDFELGLYSAQSVDAAAGRLDYAGAGGGARALAVQRYYPGINDVLGADPSGAAFDAAAMTIYRSWESAPEDGSDAPARARADIAAGERLFNEQPLRITGVRGLNDSAALGRPASIEGHCSTCHDTPNVGNHSLPLPLDIGTSHSADPAFEPDPLIRAAVAQLSGPRLPLFVIAGCPNPFAPGQAVSFYTSDPGKALISGQCSDLNRLKGPVLRGLAARAPYFHNGAAASLLELVEFYDRRFQIGLTMRQKQQLVAFLGSL